MRRHKTVIFLTLGFLVGICVLLYPAFSDFWNSKTQSRAITDYESVLDNHDENEYSAIFERAHAYNKALYETNYPLMDYKNVPGYYDTLRITDNDMIGYLKIDRIGVELPIYHGTSDDVLNRGVGHLEGSSLPIGGENTHSIMSAHRGLGDYYLSDAVQEHSRHIYDIFKLSDIVSLDANLKQLVSEVFDERKPHEQCRSAKDGIDMNVLLQEIIDKDIYKKDYENITEKMLFEDVPYSTAIKTLQKIVDYKLF